MKNKVKILITHPSRFYHNYGVQAIAFPLMEKLNKYFDAEYTFVVNEKYYHENLLFSKKYNFNIIARPKVPIMLGRDWVSILYNLASLLKKRSTIKKEEEKLLSALIEELRRNDVVVDACGIEFFGKQRFLNKWWDYMDTIYMQYLSNKYNKPYIKYTNSFGPFPDKLYRFFVKKSLNNLPFVFVRGKENLKAVKELNLKVPIYSFPDISISVMPASKDWAINYVAGLKLDPSKPIAGLSPSSVINIKTPDYIKLCEEIIKFFQSKNQQVLLIPHLLEKDPRFCDLALSKKIYRELKNKEKVFLIYDTELLYKQVRAIIGLLDFYITGRYHSVSSALSMGVPVVSFSWHIKYRDIMSLFLDDFLVIDCETTGVNKSLSLIKEYYNNRQWFNKEEVIKRKEDAIKHIGKSIDMLVGEIKKYI